MITNARKHNDMVINLSGVQIAAGKSIRYLGLQLDAKLNFSQHAALSTTKASGVMQKISRILPNVSMAKPRKRRIVSSVAQSILLYDVLNWADRMSKRGKKTIISVQRKAALRITSAYSTVSTEASLVLADLPPIDLLASERRDLYVAKRLGQNTDSQKKARRRLLIQW